MCAVDNGDPEIVGATAGEVVRAYVDELLRIHDNLDPNERILGHTAQFTCLVTGLATLHDWVARAAAEARV